MNKHTPIPWHESNERNAGGQLIDIVIRNKKRDPIALVSALGWDKKTSRANAEFIVRACNAHDDLLDACREMVEQYGGMIDGIVEEPARIAVEKAKDAIAKAKDK